jgi:hypothetical protein
MSGDGDFALVHAERPEREPNSMLGPDRRRLWADGDFNVEIDFADLQSRREHSWRSSLRTGNQEIDRKSVTVNYLSGNDWPQNYLRGLDGRAQRAGQGPGGGWIVDHRRQPGCAAKRWVMIA